MKKGFMAVLGLMVVGAVPVQAADLPAKVYSKTPATLAAAYDWSGFYVGLNAGGGTSRECWTNLFALGAPTIPAVSEGCNQTSGALMGGQVGYRWQWTNWVFGVEARGDWSNMSGANASFLLAGPPPTNQVTNQGKINGLGLFTGQIGYAWNNVLWFVKGGAAVTSNKYEGINTATTILLDQASDTRWGGAVGTGIEIGFGTNWSVGVEYEHLFLGTSMLNFSGIPGGGLSRTDTIQQNADIALLHVNYRFGGPVVAKY
jgi:outer membrane immunogenic protein